MRLVTYDDGKVGYVEGEDVVRLDVPTMRAWFERGDGESSGDRCCHAPPFQTHVSPRRSSVE